MIVTLRMPLTDEAQRDVELAVVPRVGETVEIEGDPWTVSRVVHYPLTPGDYAVPPYVVIHRESAR